MDRVRVRRIDHCASGLLVDRAVPNRGICNHRKHILLVFPGYSFPSFRRNLVVFVLVVPLNPLQIVETVRIQKIRERRIRRQDMLGSCQNSLGSILFPRFEIIFFSDHITNSRHIAPNRWIRAVRLEIAVCKKHDPVESFVSVEIVVFVVGIRG